MTMRQIVAQESGFWITDKEACLCNWQDLEDDFTFDGKLQAVPNCLLYLLDHGFLRWNGWKLETRNYAEQAEPVEPADMMVPGILYDFGAFRILAPEGWN